MLNYIWPIALVVASNVVYQICAKSLPGNINPFASLTVTYIIAAAASAGLFFATAHGASLAAEYTKLNWVPFVFGVVLVGLEAGFIYAYKVGWQISTASIVQSAFLAVALLFVGFLLYKESITPNKIIGLIVCLAGLFIINRQ
ncbi:MAG: EamA family transporter [Clostridia bacterium]|nr:EamA family transporter [Clostridia bacterium]